MRLWGIRQRKMPPSLPMVTLLFRASRSRLVDQTGIDKSISRSRIYYCKTPRAEFLSTVPPRDNDHGIPEVHELHQMKQTPACRCLAVVITVLKGSPVGSPNSPGCNVVVGCANLFVDGEEVLDISSCLGWRGDWCAPSDESGL